MSEPCDAVSPEGEKFPLLVEEDYHKEFDRLKTIVDQKRKEGKQIVVIMCLGFV